MGKAAANGKSCIFTLRAAGVWWLIAVAVWILVLLLLTQTPGPTLAPVANPPTATAAAVATDQAPPTTTSAAKGTGGTDTPAVEDIPYKQSIVDLLKSLYHKFIDYVPHLGSAILVLLVGWWLAGWLKRMLLRVMAARHVDRTLSSFLSHLCYWLIITIVVIEALENAKFATTPFSAVLGASALAVGLALQGSLANFAAGVLIILFRHFRVGDDIETAGLRGIVEEISIFNTNLRTADNRVIILANGSILSSPLINNSAKPTRRLDIVFNISYGSDLRKARQIILDILNTDQRAMKEPAPMVTVTNLGESSVDLMLRVWVNGSEYALLKEALLEAVKLRFDETGIEIPFPQHEIHVRQKS